MSIVFLKKMKKVTYTIDMSMNLVYNNIILNKETSLKWLRKETT
jgi:hypothetical protein